MPRQRGSLEDHEAQKWLWICLAETKAHLEYVKDMLLSHGDAVLKKWNKKGNTQKRRAELLSKASPKLFNARPEPSTDNPGALSFANPHLPWLDPAAFSQDRMRLLSLLHVRSEYGPDQWAALIPAQVALPAPNSYGCAIGTTPAQSSCTASITEVW
jgi:hypothetical protein